MPQTKKRIIKSSNKLSKKNTNININSGSKTNNKSTLLKDFKELRIIIKDKLQQIRDLDLQIEINKLEQTEKYKQQEDKLKLTQNIVAGVLKNVMFLNRRLTSNKIPSYIPLDKNNINSCIKAEYNIKNKLKSSGSGAFGDVFKTKGKKHTYAVKIIDINKQDDNMDYFQKGKPKDKLTIIEKEAEITKKMGDLGIGPKLYDVYHCNDNNTPKYYFVMQYMNQGSLYSYMYKNKLQTLKPDLINSIITKIQKMHDNGIIHNDLHFGNILVNKKKNGTLEFYISDFGLSENAKKQIQNEQELELLHVKNYLENGLNWINNNNNEKTIEYLAKYILANYEIDL
jgi:tRNA A-37 threonylcarbamoyl transferase component Bud32